MISIGVDIGTYSIKVAEVESTSKSYVIRRVQEFPLSLDLTKDKKIEIIDTLRTLFQQVDIGKSHFVFSVPQNAMSMRLLHFPFRERFKIQKAVASQLEDDLPFSQEDAVFDTKVVRYSGKGADVLAMAVPRERVAEILNLSHDCGVEPNLISTDSLALANLFERWSEAPPDIPPLLEIPGMRSAEVVLNIGHLSTQLLVYSDGILLGARSIDWGAKNIADAIVVKYGLNYLQAMRELQSKGFVMLDKSQGSREQVTFSQTIENSLLDFVGILRLKMLELQSEHKLQWTRGLFMGGGSQLKNLGPFLTQHFEIPFNRYRQFESHATVAEASSHLEAVSAVAVGLAIEGLKRPRNPATNFLKGEFARQSHFFESLWDRWGYTAKLAGTAFLILVAYGMLRESLALHLMEESERALTTQAEAIAGLKGRRASQANVQKFLSNVDKEAKNRRAAQKVVRLNSALDILNKISAALPPGAQLPLEIKRISIDNEMAEVHGFANSEADNGRVSQALQKISADGRVETVGARVIKVPAGKTPFVYRFKIQRFAGG
jgi:general secretion pathway protein L